MPTFSAAAITAIRNAGANAVVAQVDAGSGPGVAIIRNAGGQALFTSTLNDPSLGAAANGVVSGTIPGTASGGVVADGAVTDRAAADCILQDSDSNLVVTLTVGESSSDVNLTDGTSDGTVNIPVGATVNNLPASFTANFPNP